MTVMLERPAPHATGAATTFSPLTGPDIRRARDWTRDQLNGHPFDTVCDAVLVVSELLGNALEYGGPHVTLAIRAANGSIEITVADRGIHGEPINARPDDEHGRGRHIVRQLADHVQVEHAEDGTTVRAILHTVNGD